MNTLVVMNKGVIQQVGAPTEIYDRPANTFVASFIGNPAMNLIEGKLENGVFSADCVRIAGLNGPDGPVTLGFRAEDASLAVAETAEIAAPIFAVELLGDAAMITVRQEAGMISVKAGKDYRAPIGDEVRITVPSSICHLFSTTSGARLDA